ncbi:MAG: hypothetical protein Q9219_005399 [cf. Caloplaca sp. 3 TL-2023]
MSRYSSLQIHPGRGLGFLILGASLHDVLTRLKAQPHIYPTIDVSYSPDQPLFAPVILNLPANGFRLRFDGPDQRLRLIEILDFGKTQLSYKNIDLVKLLEEKSSDAGGLGRTDQPGPPFRHVYNRLMGPTFPGEYLPPSEGEAMRPGLYVLSYPGIAFSFPLQHSAWSPKADFVSLLSSNAAASAKSLAIFNGASWHEARQDLYTRPCLHPRSLALSTKGKEHQPDEVNLVNVRGAGVVELLRRSSSPFRIVLGETTPQDLVAELGPPDAIYRKNDHRLSIHKTRPREQRMSHGSYGASPARSDDLVDADRSSAHTTTDDSDAEDDAAADDDSAGQSAAKCFYNYFHHGFDVFISYPSNPSPPFPHIEASVHPSPASRAMDHLVATKVLLHGNVPGSYPFNRYRRSRWVIDTDASGTSDSLNSETSFSVLSDELRAMWKGNYASELAEKATNNAIVLDRDWGDSPGSSYEVLQGWEDSEQPDKRGRSGQNNAGSGTTQIYGFPGMLFEVLKNDTARVKMAAAPRKRRKRDASAEPRSDFQSCSELDMVSPASKLLPKSLPRSWASTLFLPKSSFPPRPVFNDRPIYLKRCTDHLYEWQHDNRSPARDGEFILHDGPPYANGPLHIGHALNKILKDITCRFELSLGKRVQYVPGWDCHGLPIETKAFDTVSNESKPGTFSKDSKIDPLRIRSAAKKIAHDAFVEQKKSFREWGIMADWDNAWKTMDKDFELRQLQVFSTMVKRGFISRKRKPVYWSPTHHTAMAEAELQYHDRHQSTAAYVKYPVKLIRGGRATFFYALVWTTTPWTLPANRAIAVRSDLEYTLMQIPRHFDLLVAKDALQATYKAIVDDYRNFLVGDFPAIATGTILGKDLVGQMYSDPTFGYDRYERPILDASFVSPTTGTGLVHIAPGHGFEDFELCQKHGIEPFSPVDDNGCYNERLSGLWTDFLPGSFRGLAVLEEGNEKVLRAFMRTEYLVEEHKYIHRYPYDWRTNAPLIVRATDQWFADISQIQQAALDSLDLVTFIPKTGKERLKSFVKNRKEWCISRQRAWGVPIPALYSTLDGKAILTGDSVDHIISEIERRGITAWWSDPPDDPRWVAPSVRMKYDPTEIRRGKDTMDVWFDSGTTWTQMMKASEKPFCPPADVYLEGTDQHRGWFQSSLLTYITQQSTQNSDPSVDNKTLSEAPFKTLITHGFVLDSKGLKMSKSIGNVTSPHEIMDGTLLLTPGDKRPDAMGPDALRLWVASCDYTSDVKINIEFLRTIHMTLSKYRVTFKFFLGVLKDLEKPLGIPPETFRTPHRIAILLLRQAFDNVRESYSKRDYSRAVSEINKFVFRDLSAFYVETVKDVLYADRGESRQQAQHTLLIIYHCLQTMLGPVCPLLVEESWAHSSDYMKKSFPHPLQRTWESQESTLAAFDDPHLAEDILILNTARDAVLDGQEKARKLGLMRSSLECIVVFQVDQLGEGVQMATECFGRHLTDLATMLVVSQADVYVGPIPLQVLAADWMIAEEFDVKDTKVIAYVCKPTKAKCIRCWRYLAPVEAKANEALCERCEAIVDELRESKPELFEERQEDDTEDDTKVNIKQEE